MILLLFSFLFSEIILIMVILLFKTSLMEVVMRAKDVFSKTFTRAVMSLLLFIFLLIIMPRLYNNNMLSHNMDQNHLFEATLKGFCLFLAIMIYRLQHYVEELSLLKKELSMAEKRIKHLESQSKKVNDAEANTIAPKSKKLLEENQCLKNRLSLVLARVRDLETEIGTRAKETVTLCKRIEQQESELGTKTKEACTLGLKIKQLESKLGSMTKEVTIHGARVKQLESELETKAKEANVLGARLEQLESLDRDRETKQNATSVVTGPEERLDRFDQKNQSERSFAKFDRLLDGNEIMRNQLRSLCRRLSHGELSDNYVQMIRY